MKPLVLAAVVLVPVALAFTIGRVLQRDAAADESTDATQAMVEAVGRQDLLALQQRLSDIAREQDALRAEIALLRTRAASPIEAAPASATAPAFSTATGDPPALWFLLSYERSFDDVPGGNEYLRLRVEEKALELFEPIDERVRNAAKQINFRRRLIEIVGVAGFQGDGRAAALLAWTVGSSREHDLVAAAVTAFAAVGDAHLLAILEHEVWQIPWPDLQERAIEVLVDLAGDDANALLLRLIYGAPDDARLTKLIELLASYEVVASLEAMRYASGGTKPVRLAAAQRVAQFHSDAFRAFVASWAAAETDPDVREALGQAEDDQDAPQRWAASRATGPPDADPFIDEKGGAWASRKQDMGVQWLDLGYEPARRASGARIYETIAAGAVVEVIGIDVQGGRHALWSGVDLLTNPGVFEVPFPSSTASFEFSRIRIVLDTNVPGWNEIDAVQLFGPDGEAWATNAFATSEFPG